MFFKFQIWSQNNLCIFPPTCSPFSTFNLPNDIVSGDFNGDNFPDLAVEIQSEDSIAIYIGNNSGCFTYAYKKKVNSDPLYLIQNDFNNDGKADIAVANALSNNISILINNGLSLNNSMNFSVGTFPIGLTSGELNGDQFIDIVTANNYGGISVLNGVGSGSFSAAVNYNVGSYPRSVAIGDFNSDNKNDIIVGHDNSNYISLLLNNGSGFNTALNFNLSTITQHVRVDDINFDGKNDVIVGGIAKIYILLGNGSGSFSSPITINTSGGSPNKIFTGDYNFDGHIDIANSYFFGNSFTIFFGPSFSSSSNFTTGSSPYLTVADLNSDNRPDFATANRTSDNVSVFLNNSVNLQVIASPTSVCAGNSVTFTATGATSYTWNNSSISSNYSFVPSIINTTTLSASSGTCISSKTISVNVNPNPNMIITSNSNDTICGNLTVQLNASGANSYIWSNGSNFPSTTISPVNTGSTNVIYNYSVNGTNSFGCQNTASLSLTIKPTPIVTIISKNDTLCIGQYDTLTLNIIGGTPGFNTYYWSTGVTTNSTVLTANTNTTIVAVVTASNGCIGTNYNSIYFSPCVGIEEINSIESFITVYPNPLHDFFYLKLANPVNELTFELINTNGQRISNVILNDNKFYFDMSDLSQGLYLIKIYVQGNFIGTKKIIKQ